MISIFPFELKKLLQRKAALGAFIILLIAILGLFYQYFFVGQISGYSTNKVHGRDAVAINRRIAESHSGALTDNLANRIFNDYAKEQPTLKKKGVFNVGNYYVISQLIPNSTDKLIKINSSKKMLQFHRIKLKEKEELGSFFPLKQLTLGNFAPWNELFEVSNSTYILIVLFTLFLSAPLFSGDRAKKINPILLTTRYGRGQLTWAKLASTMTIGISTFILAYALILTVFADYFGFSGWETSVQLNLYWTSPLANIMGFPVPMTISTAFVHIIVLQFVGLLFIASLNFFISSITNSPLTSFAVSTLAFFAPSFLMAMFNKGVINKLLTIFSVSTTDTPALLLKLSRNGSHGFFFDSFSANEICLISLRMLIAVLLIAYTYRLMRRRSL
ncbi:ABC transporter permease subunit [Streptococcus agalactiae]|uniref:ABC transporter permease subunit n=1 Tax=Streptococcus agalactiae TaxID=1311 RepID=UPI0022AFA8CA|nr:ABC transporter permease subunit [Streptococcus agalactiae]